MIAIALDMILNKFGGPSSIELYISELINIFIYCVIHDCTDIMLLTNIDTNILTKNHNFTTTNCCYSCIGIQIIPSYRRSKHILGLRFHPDLYLSPSEINQQLSENGIKLSIRQSYLRISPYLYNTNVQMIQLYTKLRDIIVTSGRKSLENNLSLSYFNRPKILIIGGSGWLGQHLIKNILHHSNLAKSFEIHLTYYSLRPSFLLPHQIHFLDLCHDISAIDELINQLKPGIIIHLAAQSSLIKCDQNPLIASSLNNPSYLIESIKKYVPNSLFIYFN